MAKRLRQAGDSTSNIIAELQRRLTIAEGDNTRLEGTNMAALPLAQSAQRVRSAVHSCTHVFDSLALTPPEVAETLGRLIFNTSVNAATETALPQIQALMQRVGALEGKQKGGT